MCSIIAILAAIMVTPFLLEPFFKLFDRLEPKLTRLLFKYFFAFCLVILVPILCSGQVSMTHVVVKGATVTKEVRCTEIPTTQEEFTKAVSLMFQALTFVDENEATTYVNYMTILSQQFGYPTNFGDRFLMIVGDTNYFLKQHHGN